MSARTHLGIASAVCGRGGPAPTLTTDSDEVSCTHCRQHDRPLIGPPTRFDSLATAHASRYLPKGRYERVWQLRRWRTWCRPRGIDPIEPTRVDLDQYRAELAETGQTSYALNAHIWGLRTWFRWLAEEEHIATSPALRLRPFPRPRMSTRSALTLAQQARLLDHLDTSADVDVYLRAWILLMTLTGMRPGEALAIQISGIGQHGDDLTIRLARRKASGTEIVIVPEPAAAAIRDAVGDRHLGPLILDPRTGRPLTPARARRRFAETLEAAGLPAITPACLRTSWQTVGRALGIPIDELMIGAGHASIEQSMYYNRLLDALRGEAARKLTAAVQDVRAAA